MRTVPKMENLESSEEPDMEHILGSAVSLLKGTATLVITMLHMKNLN